MKNKGSIIAVMNNKGGVGKTTVCLNLGAALANRGHNVAVLDLDSQCNLTNMLLDPKTITGTMYELLTNRMDNPDLLGHPSNVRNMTCYPNAEETAALEVDLLANPGVPEAYSIIRQKLRDHLKNHHQFTFIDCPPNMGLFAVSALYAADFAIVPVLAGSFFSLEGLLKAGQLIGNISEKANPDLRFLRLLVNAVDMRTHMGKVAMAQLQSRFGEGQVFKTSIQSAASFQQAEYHRRTILRHAPNSAPSKAYRELADELMGILELETTES